MGHIRLGRLPKTKPWTAVFAALSTPDVDARKVAAATAEAAAERLDALRNDPTLQRIVWTLARIASASKGADFAAELSQLGIDPSRARSGPGFVAEFGRVVRGADAPSVLGELALKSAQRVVAERVIEPSRSLFGSTLADVHAAVAASATPKAFGELARDFFGDFSARTIRFLAEKELSNHVGPHEAVRTVEQAATLTRDIERHCRESAEIVREFAEGWYSKANWQTDRDIDRERAEGFVGYALTKLRDEIERGGRG